MAGEFDLGGGAWLGGRCVALDVQPHGLAVDFGIERAVFAVGDSSPGADVRVRENGLGIKPDLTHRRLPVGKHVKMVGCCHYFFSGMGILPMSS